MKGVLRRSRLVAFLVWFIAFWLPPYAEALGWSYERVMELVQLVTSQALIYRLVEMVWPSLLLHLAAYYLLYRMLRQGCRLFVAFAGLMLTAIAVGQGTAFTKYGFSIIASNVAVMLLAGLLWLRDYRDRVSVEGRGPGWLLPLSLIAFIAPAPWWMRSNPFLRNPIFSLLFDAFAGSGVVAFCLFTPLALTAAARTGALRPLTVRMTAFPGIFYSLTVIGIALGIAAPGAPPDTLLVALWNAALHVPLLVTSTYYFITPYGKP